MISIEIGADFSITEGEKAFEQKESKGLILNFERAPTAAHPNRMLRPQTSVK